jgi:hypothetical protein
MDGWQWSLLLKPFAVVLLVAGYYVFVYRGSHLLGRFIPNGRLKDFLFRERGRYDAGHAPGARDQASRSADHLRSLPRGNGRKDLGGPGGV